MVDFPLSKVVIYRNGEAFRELPIDSRTLFGKAVSQAPEKPCAELNTEIDVNDSAWYALCAEGPYSNCWM